MTAVRVCPGLPECTGTVRPSESRYEDERKERTKGGFKLLHLGLAVSVRGCPHIPSRHVAVRVQAAHQPQYFSCVTSLKDIQPTLY